MGTKMAFWRLVVTVTFLAGVLTQPAAGQSSKKDPGPEEATHFDYSTSRGFPNIFAPYFGRYVPRPRLENSTRLQDLIHDGKLVLTLDDAIALALENNLAVAVARYELPIAQSDYLRTKGEGRRVARQEHFNPRRHSPVLWAQAGAVEQGVAEVARQALWEAASTAGVQRAAAIRAYTPSTAGAMPSRP